MPSPTAAAATATTGEQQTLSTQRCVHNVVAYNAAYTIHQLVGVICVMSKSFLSYELIKVGED